MAPYPLVQSSSLQMSRGPRRGGPCTSAGVVQTSSTAVDTERGIEYEVWGGGGVGGRCGGSVLSKNRRMTRGGVAVLFPESAAIMLPTQQHGVSLPTCSYAYAQYVAYTGMRLLSLEELALAWGRSGSLMMSDESNCLLA